MRYVDLKDRKERHLGEFEGRKWKGEIMSLYKNHKYLKISKIK